MRYVLTIWDFNLHQIVRFWGCLNLILSSIWQIVNYNSISRGCRTTRETGNSRNEKKNVLSTHKSQNKKVGTEELIIILN